MNRLRGLWAEVWADVETQLLKIDGAEERSPYLLVEYRAKVAVSKLVSSRKVKVCSVAGEARKAGY